MRKILATLMLLLAIVALNALNSNCAAIPNEDNWILISSEVTATVYNAVPSQCNSDCGHTASMFKLNLDDVLSHRIIAMERTMMREYGINYGDIVLIEGTETWDGIWQVQDTMNKRFAGQKKIDILVSNHIRHGKWENVKVYIPANEFTRIKHSMS